MIKINMGTLVILFVLCILIVIELNFLLSKRKKSQLNVFFIVLSSLLLIWILGIIFQIMFSNKLNINPIYFEYFVYIGACFVPVFFLLLSISFSKGIFKFTKKHLLLFIIPSCSLLVLWTNDLHHLFYKNYSTNLYECETGPYAIIHSLYSYSLMAIGLINLLKYTFKNSGFFSKQSILISLGIIIPVVTNVLRNIQNN